MQYKPTISIFDQTSQIQDEFILELKRGWASDTKPNFIQNKLLDLDAAIVFARDQQHLLDSLPTLLELHSSNIPTILICDSTGELTNLISNFDFIQLPHDSAPSTIAGVLLGLVKRNEHVSLLNSQIGFIKKMHSSLKEDLDIIQDELETAATVQREFMSNKVTPVHGISFSSLWRPAGVVSGDMYDITQLDNDHVAIFIADAIGHGISAAMLAMMLTRTLAANRHNSATGHFTEPKDVLNHLNSALLQRSGDSARFATACYGILNCKTRKLTYAGAGHPPALLTKYDGSPILLDSEGPLLGVFETDDFPQRNIQLRTGDTLLFYSDGFEHALGNGDYEEGKLHSYLQTMNEFCAYNKDDVLQKISGYLNQTLPNNADDDLTMICLHANTPVNNLRIAG
jgi:serine phosphatase RsbU (regulator of sigma subunit)